MAENKKTKQTTKDTFHLALVFILLFASLFTIFYLSINYFNGYPYYRSWDDPLNETKSLLAELVDKPELLRHTPEVIFQPGGVIATESLVQRLPLHKDQICMSTGEFIEDTESGFECVGCENSSDNQMIAYHGSSGQAAKIAVVCNENHNALMEDIDAYELGYEEGTSIKTACEVCPEDERCCAVVLKRS